MDDHQLVRITVALTPSMIHRVDERRRHEPDLPDRAELIRMLLETALSAEERERERGAARHDSQHKPPRKPSHTP
jgi:metal-responsive CopG/Arc/MetJ family transcriptional regulator